MLKRISPSKSFTPAHVEQEEEEESEFSDEEEESEFSDDDSEGIQDLMDFLSDLNIRDMKDLAAAREELGEDIYAILHRALSSVISTPAPAPSYGSSRGQK